MNEILRGKALAAEILARAQAIKSGMAEVNNRLDSMHNMEQQAKTRRELERQQQEAQRVKLIDLPSDVLRLIVRMVRQYEHILALSQCCKRLQSLISNDHAGWERMCREDWGIVENRHQDVPCILSISGAAPEDSALADELRVLSPPAASRPGTASGRSSASSSEYLGALFGSRASAASSRVRLASLLATTPTSSSSSALASRRSGSGDGAGCSSISSCSAQQNQGAVGSTDLSTGSKGPSSTRNMPSSDPQGPATGPVKPSPWHTIYRDRAQGWRNVRSVLRWLQDHNSPRSVSGSLHRLQLHLALRYMELGTGQPQDQGRRQMLLQHAGLKSLLSLLDNNSGGVQELALSVLANLMFNDPDAKVQAQLGSSMGKLLCDKLGSKTPGVVQQASRALVNMWATEGVVPEVVPLLPDNRPALPQLAPGVWHLQEFSLRGESFGLVETLLHFGAGGSVRGRGLDKLGDSLEMFEVTGSLNLNSRECSLERRYLRVEYTIQYSGYLDLHGAWGVYTTQRSQAATAFSFSTAASRQPRVFRLFQNGDQEGDQLHGLHGAELPWLDQGLVEGSEDGDSSGSSSNGSVDASCLGLTGTGVDLGSVEPLVAGRTCVAGYVMVPGCVCGTCWAL